jgi:hypothetical protein
MVSKGEDSFRTTERVLQTFPLPDVRSRLSAGRLTDLGDLIKGKRGGGFVFLIEYFS